MLLNVCVWIVDMCCVCGEFWSACVFVCVVWSLHVCVWIADVSRLLIFCLCEVFLNVCVCVCAELCGVCVFLWSVGLFYMCKELVCVCVCFV